LRTYLNANNCQVRLYMLELLNLVANLIELFQKSPK